MRKRERGEMSNVLFCSGMHAVSFEHAFSFKHAVPFRQAILFRHAVLREMLSMHAVSGGMSCGEGEGEVRKEG